MKAKNTLFKTETLYYLDLTYKKIKSTQKVDFIFLVVAAKKDYESKNYNPTAVIVSE